MEGGDLTGAHQLEANDPGKLAGNPVQSLLKRSDIGTFCQRTRQAKLAMDLVASHQWHPTAELEEAP
jgi:hypothetical protein